MKVHWWEPRRSKYTNRTRADMMFGMYEPHKIRTNHTVFTKHGVVYVTMIEHQDRLLRSNSIDELNYFTHYVLIHNGEVWRGRSWGGSFSPRGMTQRANKFARDVMRMVQDEPNAQAVSPSKEAELEIAQLRDALERLVDYCLGLVNNALPRMGIVFSTRDDMPIALRNALKLLNRR